MRPLRGPLPRVLLLLALVLGAVAAALAYFTGTGAATATGIVGTLGTPTITAATPGAGTVSLSWSPVSAPQSPAVAYYVTRAGGTVGGNCPSSPATATTSTSCTDSGLTKGTYTYTVTAVWQSWTATSASSQVTLASGAISQFLVTVPANATAGTPLTATITAQDAQNNTVTSYTGSQTIAFTGPATSPGGTPPPTPPRSPSPMASPPPPPRSPSTTPRPPRSPPPRAQPQAPRATSRSRPAPTIRSRPAPPARRPRAAHST